MVKQGERLKVAGFAWSGAVALASVAISSDGGESWGDVELQPGEGRFAWRRFEAEIVAEQPGPFVVMARARDAEGGVQPLEPVWNPRGYCNNQVQRVRGSVIA